MSLTLADIRDTPECGNVTGPYASTRFRPRCGKMRPRSVGFGGRFVGRGFVAKGVTFLDFTLKRPLVVHIDEPRPRLMSSTSPFRTDAPRSDLTCEFCGRFTLQYGILQHMAVTASCWALSSRVKPNPCKIIQEQSICLFHSIHSD